MSRTITDLERKNPASFCRQGSRFWPFSPWSRVSHVLCSIFMFWLVKSWQVSSCGKFMQHLETCLLVAETDRVLCNVVKLLTVFFYWMHKMKYSCWQDSLLFMAGFFIGFLVEKCATCQSHRKSDFEWIAFTRFPLLNAYCREGSKKSQAILMAFRNCILTGKPELLLYLMCFFFRVS